MIIPDICNVLSTSGKEFSLSHWYSPIIDSWVTKIEVQRKHLFQIFRIYWIDSLFNMQVFWDLRMQWSNCPYFVAKKDLHWIYLVEKGKSGYSCQDAKFRSTPMNNTSIDDARVWINQWDHTWQWVGGIILPAGQVCQSSVSQLRIIAYHGGVVTLWRW